MTQPSSDWEQLLDELSPQERSALNYIRTSAATFQTEPRYTLISVDEVSPVPLQYHYFSSLGQLADAMRQLPETVRCIPILGYVLQTTDPGAGNNLRYLVGPRGETAPLFVIQSAPRLSESPIYSGSNPATRDLFDPPPPPPPRPRRRAAEEEEPEPEDEGSELAEDDDDENEYPEADEEE